VNCCGNYCIVGIIVLWELLHCGNYYWDTNVYIYQVQRAAASIKARKTKKGVNK
jgi:hypothetical protein